MPPAKPAPLQFYNHQAYIKRYQAAKTYDDFAKLQREVQAEENRYREMFAKSRHSKTLQDENLMMIPVFKNIDSFALRPTSPEEDKIPKIFEPKTRPPAGSRTTVATQEEFTRNFNLFTENLLKGLNWDSIISTI